MRMRTGYLLLAILWGSLASPATAEACTQWSAAGVYTVRQSNGFTVSLTVFQAGDALSGEASYPGGSGVVEGWIKGPEFDFTIYWRNGARGSYNGFVDPAGAIVGGTTYDLDNRSSSATWATKKRLRCVVD